MQSSISLQDCNAGLGIPVSDMLGHEHERDQRGGEGREISFTCCGILFVTNMNEVHARKNSCARCNRSASINSCITRGIRPDVTLMHRQLCASWSMQLSYGGLAT